jgi:RNA polymerase sigma-70 factor (ECF subfamily)
MSVDVVTDPETWVDRHGDTLYRYALLRLRSPDLAADVVQDTYVEALRVLGSFEGRSSERTWLIGILRHKIVDHLRRAGREAAVGQGTSSHDPRASAFDSRGRWQVGPASWGGDPSRQIESREFWDVLGRCLSKLPQGLADTFFLRELDDLCADEVQEILGITPANLWKRLHRARSLLRQCLESGWFQHRTMASTPS